MDSYTPKVSVIGLGYVGLPVAVHMAKEFQTIGFDLDPLRIAELKLGRDRTLEVSEDDLKEANVKYTDKVEDLRNSNFYIIAVPTPINSAKTPDLRALLGASETVGKVLKKGDIVVYESTVYPGATEEDCLPVLERVSGLKGGEDFKLGYSPERINPGDKEHTFTKITKVVSGEDDDTLNKVAYVYEKVVTAGVFRAKSIKVAEAAKVIENTQRDVNIALMNELAVIFEKMDISSFDVIEAASTKWNFLKFTPGLVGGHCIGVDPYYLTYKAQALGYHPDVILSGRRINDSMGQFLTRKIIKAMIASDHGIRGENVNVYGVTFKENCPDLRNTKVTQIVEELKEYGMNVNVTDPWASKEEALEELNIELIDLEKMPQAKVSVFAVAHDCFKGIDLEGLGTEIVIDVKNIFPESPSEKIEMIRL